ncbi:MAG: hypothetical protein ACHQYQ_05320 [Bacteriovoracales bacterium]
MKKSILALLLVLGCGKNAPQAVAEKFIINHKRPESISSLINLKKEPEEIIIFAFPNESEVKDYSYDAPKRFANEEDFKDLFSLINYGDKYTFDITKEMTPKEKVQGIMGKVVAISDARDSAKRNFFELKKKESALVEKMNEKLNEIPCYKVTKRRHKNIGKCYLKPIPDITNSTPEVRSMTTCADVASEMNKYVGLNADTSIPASAVGEYILSSDKISDLESQSYSCKMLDKNYNLAGVGKLEVAMLVGLAEIEGGDKLVFKARSEEDGDISADDSQDDPIEFDSINMTFKKFSMTIDFQDESGPTVYSPEKGNMTQPVVSEINGSGFYQVNFEIKGPGFTLKTLGLSLTIDSIFGLRMAGKTMLYYNNGNTRPGVFRLDISPEE